MDRRKFLKLLGLAPVLGVVAAKVGLPDPAPEEPVTVPLKEAVEAEDTYTFTDNYAQVVTTTTSGTLYIWADYSDGKGGAAFDLFPLLED